MQRPGPRNRILNRDPRNPKVSTPVSSWLNFTPLSLSPQLWLDAADSTTITESGGAVSQWNDKSGNGYDVVQASESAQPGLVTAGQNGLNVINFDGSNDRLQRSTATALGKNVSGLTTYIVRLWDILPATDRRILEIIEGQIPTQGRVRILLGGGLGTANRAFAGGRTLDLDSFQSVVSSDNVSTSSYQIQTGVFDYANTDLFIYLDGSLQGTNASFQTATTTSNTDSANLVVGSSVGGSSFFDGKVAEILVYHDAHTAGQRQAVWRYLAQKWGLTI